MKKKRKYILTISIALFVFILLNYKFSLAKYVSNSVWDYYLKSKDFYFTSDELSESGKENINNLWDGESAYFTIKNGINDSVITNYNISYKAECNVLSSNKEAKCTLNGSDKNVFEGILANEEVCINKTSDGVDTSGYNKTTCEVNGYTWKNKMANKELFFDIVGEEIENAEVEVIVTTTSPYQKRLTGKFLLKKDPNLTGNIKMEYNHYTDYDELVVSNSYQEEKDVTISFDSTKLRIDYEKDKIVSYDTDDNSYIKKIYITLPKKSTQTHKFYKLDSTEYDKSAFQLTEESPKKKTDNEK